MQRVQWMHLVIMVFTNGPMFLSSTALKWQTDISTWQVAHRLWHSAGVNWGAMPLGLSGVFLGRQRLASECAYPGGFPRRESAGKCPGTLVNKHTHTHTHSFQLAILLAQPAELKTVVIQTLVVHACQHLDWIKTHQQGIEQHWYSIDRLRLKASSHFKDQ